jgi:hypothetical protein
MTSHLWLVWHSFPNKPPKQTERHEGFARPKDNRGRPAAELVRSKMVTAAASLAHFPACTVGVQAIHPRLSPFR